MISMTRLPLADDQPINVVQISDPHLFADVSGRLLGMNTEQSFRAVMALVRREHPQFDLLLATGDIAQSPAASTYIRFHQAIAEFAVPQFWLQGNHDLDQIFGSGHPSRECTGPILIEAGAWRIIMLNSSVDHEVAGCFEPSELAWLAEALEQSRQHPVMVCLHHHPLAVGSYWLDQHMLSNAAPFWTVLEQYSNVAVVMHGHVHQHVDYQYGGIRVLACPSTCIQFKPQSRSFALDAIAPGYRWLILQPNGSIETGVSRLDHIPAGVDFESLGY
jgi:Icc protein